MRYAVLLFLLGFTLPTIGQTEKPTIIGIEIFGLHQQDAQGAYDRIIRQILGADIELLVHPPERASEEFGRCQNCCLSPANKNPEFYDYGNDVVQSHPMNSAKIYIFVDSGSPPVNTLDELKGKRVGIRFGMPYGKSVETSNLDFNIVNKLKQNVLMLDMGRIDAIIAYVPDIYQVFEELNRRPFPHDKANPLEVHRDSLICRGVDSKLINEFNAGLKTMRENKQLQAILGSSYLEY